MKNIIKTIFILLLPVFGWAQNSIINITAEKFNKEYDSYSLGDVDGWVFHQGNDSNWAKENIDLSDWKKLKPTEISIKYADENGRAEGWFRTKIKLDNSLGNNLFGVNLGTWAASDLYVNGKLITSNGHTGIDGKPFKEGNPYGKLSYPSNLKAGEVYAIAIHFVDYKSTLPPSLLRSYSLKNIISITGSKSDSYVLEYIKQNSIFSSISLSVCAILSLLFWILFIQNPTEKNLGLIAYGTTCNTITFFSVFQLQYASVNYNTYEIWTVVNVFVGSLTFIFILLIIVNIFKRKVTKGLNIFILIYFISSFGVFLIPATSNILDTTLTGLIFILCLYYIVTSWKNLKGAQWAVVVGILVFLLLLIAMYIFKNHLISFIVALAFPLSLLVYVSMRFKEIITEVQQNANQVLQLSEEKKEYAENQQKILQEEVNKQTSEIRTTLDNLKATQSQLIQSEKMASLGELTAGIAHEIQNPLNFVNNFSDLNKELLQELKEVADQGNLEEVIAIANDVIGNEEKINHHGKRADAIVKGMLQHSQSNKGVRELTDINALADEYLRLSYHGLRAKDKSFNAEMKTDFEENLPKIAIVPQDFGRVFLNLINNAFYAVNEKQKAEGYKPTVTISTKSINGNLEIIISDNGNGIPQNIIDKIFQPFFTTKPTGKGTGLGLSLAYDIVKAHGGELKVETEEKTGTEFIIELPINTNNL